MHLSSMHDTPTVLLLHSTATTAEMWAPYEAIVAPLGAPLRPVHIGYPPRPPVNGVVVTAADDAATVLQQLDDAHPGGGPVDIVAHSYGGLVALTLAPLLGTRLRSLFLFEPTLFSSLRPVVDTIDAEARATLEGFANDPHFLHDDQYGGSEPWIERFIDFWNRPGSWQRMPPAQQAVIRTIGWKMYQEVRSVNGPDALEQLTLPASMPITLALGSRTPAIAHAVISLLAARYPNARIVTLEGTGHMAPVTHVAPTRDVLAEHVAYVLHTTANQPRTS